MVSYVCKNCDKKFNSKDSYKFHISKNNLCSLKQKKLENLEDKINKKNKDIDYLLAFFK